MTGRAGRRLLVALLALPVVVALAPTAAGATRGTVFIQTSPALAGVHLLVGSQAVTTGPGGTAAVVVPDFNGIASRVSLASRALDGRTTLSVVKVRPSPHRARYESHLTVGLDVSSTVRLRVDPGSTGVDPGTVRAVRLHSVTGTTRVVDPQRTPVVSLLARKARLVAGRITSQVVTWSVDSLRAAPGVSMTTDRGRFDPLSGASWRLRLQPVHGTVIVDTVPATPGVSFLLDGASFTTDQHGHASSDVSDVNGVDQRLRLGTPQATGATVSMLRVSRLPPGAAFQRHLLVALAVSRPVRLRFVDPSGQPVPARRISEVRLDGGGGSLLVTGDQLVDPVSLLSAVGRLVNGVWTPRPVTYAVTRVTVEGANAVFTRQQRVDPGAAEVRPISLSVFDVQVTVRDVLFGSRIGSAAYVGRPDGRRLPVQLGAERPTVFPALVRGEYTLTTEAAVFGATSRFLVSKASDVELRVVTPLDALVVLVALSGLAGLLVALGGASRRRSTRTPPGGPT